MCSVGVYTTRVVGKVMGTPRKFQPNQGGGNLWEVQNVKNQETKRNVWGSGGGGVCVKG